MPAPTNPTLLELRGRGAAFERVEFVTVEFRKRPDFPFELMGSWSGVFEEAARILESHGGAMGEPEYDDTAREYFAPARIPVSEYDAVIAEFGSTRAAGLIGVTLPAGRQYPWQPRPAAGGQRSL